MAAKELKITFSGDTKSYRQEVDKAAIATNKFQKDAGSAVANLAGVFGVNIGAIRGSIDGMSKGFTMMLTSMKASAAGATIWQGAMNIIKIATISTGVGALVVAVGSLIAYFTKTREGANFVKAAMASLGAAVRVVIDHFSSFGEGIFKLFKGDWAGSAAAFKASISGIGKEMLEEGKAAGDLARRTQALNKVQRESEVINAERRAQVAELRKEAKDTEEFDAKTRKQKLAQSREILSLINKDERSIAAERLAIFQAEMGMRKASGDDLNKEKELKMSLSAIDREYAMDEKGLLGEMKGVTKEINAQAEAQERLAKEKRKEIMGKRPEMMQQEAGMFKYTNNEDLKKLYDKDVQKAMADMTMHLESGKVQAKAVQDEIAANTIDLSSTLNGAWASSAEGLGVFLGNLMAGKGSIQDFGSMVAGAFADLAITIGQQMIAFGATGIALKFLIKNPWLALAAGVALVAVGQAAKSRISASISGGGGASSAASAGGGNYNYDSRQSMGSTTMQNINLTVTGELKAKGSDLVTVLDTENQRKAIVT